MFNEEQKKRFIRDYTGSLNTANVAVAIFNATEKFEESWNDDICTKDVNALQLIIDDIVGLRAKSKWMTLTILKEYSKWCLAMKVPNACDGMLKIEAIGLNKVKKQMVANPLHLQNYLDAIFDSEYEETIDNVYRCYFWMAYMGIGEDDVSIITSDDVNLNNYTVHYKGNDIPMYRESIKVFENVTLLEDFLYKHPNYETRRNRVAGNTILRGVKTTADALTLRRVVSMRRNEASKDAARGVKTDQQLSFYRVRMSGLFYRMAERERAGIPVDFSEAALQLMDGKTYSLSGREKIIHKQNRIERDYFDDYQRWKLAFSI